MSRWRQQQRKRARAGWLARQEALAVFDRFEAEHPVTARRWLQAHGQDRGRAAVAAVKMLLDGRLPDVETGAA